MAKYINTQQKGPVSKTRFGRFEASIWQWLKVVSAPREQRDFRPEREYVVKRACIRHSRWDKVTKTWDEQVIWCNVHELDSLREAIERLQAEHQT